MDFPVTQKLEFVFVNSWAGDREFGTLSTGRNRKCTYFIAGVKDVNDRIEHEPAVKKNFFFKLPSLLYCRVAEGKVSIVQNGPISYISPAHFLNFLPPSLFDSFWVTDIIRASA